MSLPGEMALQALDLTAVLGGAARWTAGAHDHAIRLPDRYKRAIRKILAAEQLDRLPVVSRPSEVPPGLPPVDGGPPDLDEALRVVLSSLSHLRDFHATESPVGPLPRPATLQEDMAADLLWRTVDDPMTVLVDASRNAMSRSQLDALEASYPDTLGFWRELLQTELAARRQNAPVLGVRRFCSLILDIPAAPAPPVPQEMQAPGGPPRGAKRPPPTDPQNVEATAAQRDEAE